jgi:hypothetical protein
MVREENQMGDDAESIEVKKEKKRDADRKGPTPARGRRRRGKRSSVEASR